MSSPKRKRRAKGAIKRFLRLGGRGSEAGRGRSKASPGKKRKGATKERRPDGTTNGATNGTANGTANGAGKAALAAPPYRVPREATLFDEDGRRKQRLYKRLFTVLGIGGLISLPLSTILLVVVLLHLLSGGSGSTDGGSAAGLSSSEKEQAARAYAAEFSREYLKLDPSEGNRVRQERLSGFLAQDVPASAVAPVIDAEKAPKTSRSVQTSTPYYSEVKENGTVVVYTSNMVNKKDDPDAKKDKSSDVGLPERWALSVPVGVDDSGNASVLAAPTLVATPGSYSGEAGVLTNSKLPAEKIDDPHLKTLLNGYLAALYGRQESRDSLSKFFASGAGMPAQPPDGFSFVSLDAGWLHPRLKPDSPTIGADRKFEDLTVGGFEFTEVYDAELYVTVTDEQGLKMVQTQLVRLGKTEGGDWLLAGTVS